jgi:DtxR family Mn-dependent transcriptional regulator
VENTERDECLERLWSMKERGVASTEDLRAGLTGWLDPAALELLVSEGWIVLGEGGTTVGLTEKGDVRARQLIRAHRLAERLVRDVLGATSDAMETDACEFEHVVAPELVDSICTLLGHPNECPHGRPIPQGECCRRKATTLRSSAVPLTQIQVGQSARVAFVRCEHDAQMHRLDGLRITPGSQVRLHQRFPAYVIECEGAKIALEEKMAASIHVWLKADHTNAPDEHPPAPTSRRRRRFGFGRGRG